METVVYRNSVYYVVAMNDRRVVFESHNSRFGNYKMGHECSRAAWDAGDPFEHGDYSNGNSQTAPAKSGT